MTDPEADQDAIDLDRWTPAGKASVDYAIELLRSTHPAEFRGAERWLLAHPAQARPALEAALETPSAQAAAALLGLVGEGDSIAALVDAWNRGGQGLRAAASTGLGSMADRGVPGAADALADLRPEP